MNKFPAYTQQDLVKHAHYLNKEGINNNHNQALSV